MMNLNIISLPIRAFAITLLVMSFAGVNDQKSAYADSFLPIVVDHGTTISIEVYPQKHQLIVRKQGGHSH